MRLFDTYSVYYIFPPRIFTIDDLKFLWDRTTGSQQLKEQALRPFVHGGGRRSARAQEDSSENDGELSIGGSESPFPSA